MSNDEIKFVINGYTQGAIPDYQMSAFLMALCFTGIDDCRTSYMTKCMVETGDVPDLSDISGIVADKHSTGGVGDKTTLVVVPIVAACGGKVAKMSGRGLGYTGGTIDKLESIEGFNTSLGFEKFIEQVNVVGAAIVAQMQNLAPADKKIYALRDVTGTVDCLPLIASSIMSKKLASGADAIVLDVKYGSGAFMKTLKQAQQLADLMVSIGENNGKKMKALITDMSVPLGEAIGNSLEVIEAVKTLKGLGPKDLSDLCIEIAASMLELSLDISYAECVKLCENSISSGSAFNKFSDIVKAQGGNISCIDDIGLFKKADYIKKVKSPKSGEISLMNTEKVGEISCRLGAGCLELDDKIDHSAGIIIKKKTGDLVKPDDTLAILHTNNKEVLKDAEAEYLDSISIQ